jgi:hypothetical protein
MKLQKSEYIYREDFYFVDRFHGSAFQGEQGATCFVKKHRCNNPSCIYSTPDNNFHWMKRDFVG